MSGKSSIEWTDATWNPIRARLKEYAFIGAGGSRVVDAGTWGYHYERVSPGCTNCYAEAMNGRTLPAWGTGLDYTRQSRDKVDIYLDEQELLKPLHWKKPRMVFVASMTDLFAEFVPDEFIDRMMAAMSHCPRHTFQILTKRPKRMREYFANFVPSPSWDGFITRGGVASNDSKRGWPIFSPNNWPLFNLWLGVSVEDHPRADERLPHLLATPAAVRWVSYEPALGPVDFRPYLIESGMAGTCWDIEHNRWHNPGICPHCSPALSWIVAGGESGRDARPCDLAWLRSVRDQCAAAAVPVFMKQLGARPCIKHTVHSETSESWTCLRLKDRKGGDPAEWPADLRVRQMPAAAGARA